MAPPWCVIEVEQIYDVRLPRRYILYMYTVYVRPSGVIGPRQSVSVCSLFRVFYYFAVL